MCLISHELSCENQTHLCEKSLPLYYACEITWGTMGSHVMCRF